MNFKDMVLKYLLMKVIYVVKLTSDGAASKAGIQQGDVIVKLDGKDITTYNRS